MSHIPKKLLALILADPYYQTCIRANAECEGRITLDHTFTYGGKNIQEKWAIVPVCWEHHLGNHFIKKVNQVVAWGRATKDELAKYPRLNFRP